MDERIGTPQVSTKDVNAHLVPAMLTVPYCFLLLYLHLSLLLPYPRATI